MVLAQGGRPESRRPVAPSIELNANRAGVVVEMDTEALGLAIIALGGSHRELGDPIDHSVGLEMLVRLGNIVSIGTPLIRIFSNHPDTVAATIHHAIRISDDSDLERQK